MANIKPYVDKIKTAVYGEEVRESIVNAIEKVNDDNESYQEIKEQVSQDKAAVDAKVAEFGDMVTEVEQTKAALDTSDATAKATKTALETATANAVTAKTNLETATQTANSAKSALVTATQNANTAKTNADASKTALETATKNANTAKSNLDTAKANAETALSNLNTAISQAGTSKSNLETTISNANTAKSQLQAVISNSETAKTNLSTVIASATAINETLSATVATANDLNTALGTKNGQAQSNIEQLDTRLEDADEILTGVEDIKAYLGYVDEDIVGICVDYKNKTFQRLAGAYNLSGGEDFNSYKMFGGRRRCNVSDDGTIVAWYGDADYAEDGSMGQVMVYQPKFYYKVVPLVMDRQTDGIGYHLRKANYYVSTTAKYGFKCHPAFIDKNGNEVDFILLSAYEGSIYDVDGGEDGTGAFLMNDEQVATFSSDKFCSIAGAKPASGLTQNLTRPNVQLMAQNRGENWHSDYIKATSANQLLMVIEMGTMNLQTAIGNGVVSISDSSAYNCSSLTGSTSALGNGTGQAAETINEKGGTQTTETANGKTSITYRGVENPWGNIWKFVYGVNIHGNGSQKGGIPYICSDFAFAESKNSGNYKSAGFTVSNASGYISAMGYGDEEFDWLFMPSECTGTSSLPVGDYTYVSANLNGYRIALLGGTWNYGGDAGAFCWHVSNGVGDRSRRIGGRLVYVPEKDTTTYNANIADWEAQMTA